MYLLSTRNVLVIERVFLDLFRCALLTYVSFMNAEKEEKVTVLVRVVLKLFTSEPNSPCNHFFQSCRCLCFSSEPSLVPSGGSGDHLPSHYLPFLRLDVPIRRHPQTRAHLVLRGPCWGTDRVTVKGCDHATSCLGASDCEIRPNFKDYEM